MLALVMNISKAITTLWRRTFKVKTLLASITIVAIVMMAGVLALVAFSPSGGNDAMYLIAVMLGIIVILFFVEFRIARLIERSVKVPEPNNGPHTSDVYRASHSFEKLFNVVQASVNGEIAAPDKLYSPNYFAVQQKCCSSERMLSNQSIGRVDATNAYDSDSDSKMSSLLAQPNADSIGPLVESVLTSTEHQNLQQIIRLKPVRPGLCSTVLDPGASYLVISTRALSSGVWGGALESSGLHLFNQLKAAISEARSAGNLVVLIDHSDNAGGHFMNSLVSLVDVVIRKDICPLDYKQGAGNRILESLRNLIEEH